MNSRVLVVLCAMGLGCAADPGEPQPALTTQFTPPPPPPPPPTPSGGREWPTEKLWTARLDDGVLVVGPISEAMVSQVVRGREVWLRDCQRIATPEGRFVARIDIDAHGRVQEARAATSSGNETLDTCLLAKLRTIRFPAPTSGAKSIAHLPLLLGEVEEPWRLDGAGVIGPVWFSSRKPIIAGGADTVITGSLDPAIIEAVIKRHLAQLLFCYERELLANPKLAGKIVESFTIEPDGRVSVARAKSSSMGHQGVEACIDDRFLKIRFPHPRGTVTVDYPLVFKRS